MNEAILGGLQVGDAAGRAITPIRFTDGQSRSSGALWSFQGRADGERIMQRAGLDSDKPNGLFEDQVEGQGANRARRLDWRPTEHSSSRSNARACIPCLARRQCWRDGLLLQASPTTNGNGTRTIMVAKAMCVCHGEEVSADFEEEGGNGAQLGMFLPDHGPRSHAECAGTRVACREHK